MCCVSTMFEFSRGHVVSFGYWAGMLGKVLEECSYLGRLLASPPDLSHIPEDSSSMEGQSCVLV